MTKKQQESFKMYYIINEYNQILATAKSFSIARIIQKAFIEKLHYKQIGIMEA